MGSRDTEGESGGSPGLRGKVFAAGVVFYVASVLLIDTFAMRGVTWGIDWRFFRWTVGEGFDAFKFTAWFVLPLLFSLRSFDPKYFTFGRWKKADWILMAVAVGSGALVMAVFPLIPGVADYYQGWGNLAPERRLHNAQVMTLWTFSWLTGWEFMHRYALLKPMVEAWPKRGWIAVLVIIPFLEGAYHVIQGKPQLECLGMWALALFFCAWALRRRNALLPFLAHLAIELELIAMLYFS